MGLEEFSQFEGSPLAPVLADFGFLLVNPVVELGGVNPLETYLDVCVRCGLTYDHVNRGMAAVLVFPRLDPGKVESAGDVTFKRERCGRVHLDMHGVSVRENIGRLARWPKLVEVDASFDS